MSLTTGKIGVGPKSVLIRPSTETKADEIITDAKSALSKVKSQAQSKVRNIPKPDIARASRGYDEVNQTTTLTLNGVPFANAQGEYSQNESLKRTVTALGNQEVVIVEQHNKHKLIVLVGDDIPPSELRAIRENLKTAGLVSISKPASGSVKADIENTRHLGKVLKRSKFTG